MSATRACARCSGSAPGWATRGLPVSSGTLAGSVPRFMLLFEPVAGAILAHQHAAALRHADETTWRVQALRGEGHSGRAWLWTAVGNDAVRFHIDASRSAEAAAKLFGELAPETVIVCDRYSAYKRLARLLGGTVVLAFCWAHMRRDFIECAAAQVRLTGWCEGLACADRRDLPPERGAAGLLRPRHRAPERGLRRGAGRARGGPRRPVRDGATGAGRPAGPRAGGQAAALARQPPRGAQRVRRPSPGAARQQSRRAAATGAGHRTAPVVRLRQRDRRAGSRR